VTDAEWESVRDGASLDGSEAFPTDGGADAVLREPSPGGS